MNAEEQRRRNEEFARIRQEWADRETAQWRAADRAFDAVVDAITHIELMDFGTAKRILEELRDFGLPNDHGGPVTHYPHFEEELEKIVARRAEA